MLLMSPCQSSGDSAARGCLRQGEILRSSGPEKYFASACRGRIADPRGISESLVPHGVFYSCPILWSRRRTSGGGVDAAAHRLSKIDDAFFPQWGGRYPHAAPSAVERGLVWTERPPSKLSPRGSLIRSRG